MLKIACWALCPTSTITTVCGDCRPPARVSTCELEVDAVAEDILNRAERLRVPLPDAPQELRLVESLGLM